MKLLLALLILGLSTQSLASATCAKLPPNRFQWKTVSVLTSDHELAIVAAIITTESAWNPSAVSSAGAIGLMQVTPIAQVDAVRHCGPTAAGELTNTRINIIAGTCYLSWLRSQGMTWDETIITYNGGFRQLSNFRAGRPLAAETMAYKKSVPRLARQYCGGHQ